MTTGAMMVYTMEEISHHNSKHDCWIIIDGKVYNVTAFLTDHPGGEQILLEYGGKDATAKFEQIGHSRHARELKAHYMIGTVA